MRLSVPDYINDHSWEMELGYGEPPALSLHTTYGLRARSVRIFPRFSEDGVSIADIFAFATPPVLRSSYPNYLELTFSPFEGLEVTYEVRVPDSHSLAGRVTIHNRSTKTRKPSLEICAALVPLDGHAFSHTQMQMVNVLVGQTSGLVPLLFLTGGPLTGPGPQPSLMVDLNLDPGTTRQLTWSQAATPEHQTSFDTARLIAAQPWDAERARIELVNAGDIIDIQTGDPEWDAALAFSQKAAFSLFFPANDNLPQPSFVQARGPDHGYSRKGDGSDYPASWNGQTPLDAYFLSSVLPAAPKLMQGVLRNFLTAQTEDGMIDGRPGLGGQRGRYQAMPILASLAWNLYSVSEDDDFLEEVFPHLLKFFWAWFSPINDLDRDGIPQWTHLLQTGYEENPSFDTWNPWSQGADITYVHDPALIGMLYCEAQVLILMAEQLGQEYEVRLVKKQVEGLKSALDKAWNPRTSLYRYRDRETGASSSGKVLGRKKGYGTIKLKQTFEPPVRLLIEVQTESPGSKRPQVIISEYVTKGENEVIRGGQFHWRSGGMVATSQQVHEKIGRIQIKGIDRTDNVIVRRLDYSGEDHTLLLPLWAGVPDTQQAQVMIGRTILNAERFDRPFGIPACPKVPNAEADSACSSVYLPWNLLIGEGMLAYGFRQEAARLVAHFMTGVIKNLKQKRSFYQRYHADTGLGLGERNAVSGLAPVGLFLQILGVQVLSPTRVRLEGINPFPWPVTIQYKGLIIVREFDRTEVRFPNGKHVSIDDPAACVVSL
ncbi:MAG: hypothetical protein WBL25_00905 [Anaerolineales bacterium]